MVGEKSRICFAELNIELITSKILLAVKTGTSLWSKTFVNLLKKENVHQRRLF